ncbi:MAG: tetratricopeptide repeat protein, partial [Bacteroidales bacterium]|nr:tetratricopeptide repeat protein [Bacteroidales bacterium]
MIKSAYSYLLLFIIFNLLFFKSFAQDTFKIDSLTNVLSETPEDSVKVEILLKLFWEHRRTNPKMAMEYAEQSLEISQSIDYLKGIANSLQNIGIIRKVQGNYDKASDLLIEANSYYEKLEDTVGIV